MCVDLARRPRPSSGTPPIGPFSDPDVLDAADRVDRKHLDQRGAGQARLVDLGRRQRAEHAEHVLLAARLGHLGQQHRRDHEGGAGILGLLHRPGIPHRADADRASCRRWSRAGRGSSRSRTGTVVVISMVPTPPSMAARQAWNPASGSWVRSTPQSAVGKDLVDALHSRADYPYPLLATQPRSESCGMVHTYDRGDRGDREHPGADHPRRRRLAPRERLLRHQRPVDRLQGRRRDRQPPVLVPHQVRAPGRGLAVPDRQVGRGAPHGPEPADRPARGPRDRRRSRSGTRCASWATSSWPPSTCWSRRRAPSACGPTCPSCSPATAR